MRPEYGWDDPKSFVWRWGLIRIQRGWRSKKKHLWNFVITRTIKIVIDKKAFTDYMICIVYAKDCDPLNRGICSINGDNVQGEYDKTNTAWHVN